MTDLMKKYLKSVDKVDGIYAEFGVYKGNNFRQLVQYGSKIGKFVIGVDSFQGMGEPTEQDADEKGIQHYPKGKLSTDGCDMLRESLAKAGHLPWEYALFEGFVPEVLKEINPAWKYSFCYIDFDHYLPTKQAIDFVWDKMCVGGLILFDDYIPSRNNMATLAIKEFLFNNKSSALVEEYCERLIEGGCKSQVLVRKIR